MSRLALCLLLHLAAFRCTLGAERAGDTTALPSQGNETVFTGPHARYVVTVEAAGARCAVPADFDGDGDMDIVSVSSNDNTVAWYERLEDGTYGPKKMISRASNGARIVTTGDIDQDGKIDVIVASYYDHTVGWFKNLGGGKFGPMNMVSRSANSAQGVSVADMDNDGDLDILSASSGDNTVAWYENLGGGTFCEVRNIIDDKSMGIRTVVAADIDEDGDMDMAVASKDDSKVTWYRNDGKMKFTKMVIDDQAGGSYSLVVKDVDKDGHLDIVGAANAEGKDVSGEDEGGKINFYRGDGKGNFVKIGVTGPNDYEWFALSVWSGDLDGDGDEDIASASFGLKKQGSISWYENVDGKGNQWTRHKIYITTARKTGHYVFGADMDGDGDNDLIAVTNGDDTVQILYAHTNCDDSKTNPRSECCTEDQYWDGSVCTSCELGKFKDMSSGSPVCSPCSSACPRPGLASLPKSCWSMAGCYDAAVDMARCDCGKNHFLDTDLSICKRCANGMVTQGDTPRKPSNHSMVTRKFLDQTKYMISDMSWKGFDESRCIIPTCDEPGEVFNVTLNDCSPCPSGTYSPGRSAVKCEICIPGHRCPEKTSNPIGCQAGFFSVGGQEACTESPAGFFCPEGRLAEPRPCPSGSYSDSRGAKECKTCDRGKYAMLDESNGTLSCSSCPSGTTTAIVGAKIIQDCFCRRGSFHECNNCSALNKDPSAVGFCQPCPAGAVCEGPSESPTAMVTDAGGEHRPPRVPKGFMSIGTSVYMCGGDGEACPGSFMFEPEDKMCKHEGAGIACASCPDEYFWRGSQCHECGGGSALGFVSLVVVMLFGSGIFIYYWNQKAAKVEAIESVLGSVTIGVTVSFMQTLGIFSRMSFSWPLEFRFCLDIMNLFVFDLSVLRLGCMFNESLAVKAMPSLLMPILLISIFLAWYPLSMILNKLSAGRFVVFNKDAIFNALGMILQAFYISIVLTVAKAFDCFGSPNGERALRMSPANICWEGDHVPLIIVSALAGIVYVVGFFAFLTWAIIQAPIRVVDRSFATRFKFVIFKYTPTTWWFGLPLMIRSILISLVNVVSPDDGYIQFLLMLFILVIFGFWHLMYLPYSDRYANNLETAELGLLIVMLGLGSWFMARNDGSSNADDDPDKASILSAILIVLLIASILMVVGVFLYAFHQATFPEKARKKVEDELLPLLPNIGAAGLILQGLDSDHLLKLLQHATYLDVNYLVHVVDFITVEVGGVLPDSHFRARLPKLTTEIRRNSKEAGGAKGGLIRSASKMGLGDEGEISERVHRRPSLGSSSTKASSNEDTTTVSKLTQGEELHTI